MNTQTITQIGNSDGVTIPAHLMKEIGLKKGQKVFVERIPGSKNLIIVTEPQGTKGQNGLTKEFRTWLASFLEEDKEILEELTGR